MTRLVYDTRKLRLEWIHHMTGAGYNPEVGFVLRNDIFLISPEASIRFFPKNEKIAQYTIGGDFTMFYNCLLYTSPSPRDATLSRMPSSA